VRERRPLRNLWRGTLRAIRRLMSDWIIGFVRSGGYAGIAFLMTIENLFPPIPSELIMPLAGYLAASDSLVLWAAIAAGTLGSVVGAVALYYVGKRVGSARLKRFADRHGCWMALSRSDIERSEHWFARRGIFAVFVCRLVPGIRSMISVPAGIARMNLGLFLIATTVGSAMWTAILACVGYWLGRNFEAIEQWIGWVTFAVTALLVAWYLQRVWRNYHPRREAQA
jgi:membrane protein DedA with SNARE-associated domain